MNTIGNKDVLAENLRFYVEKSGKSQKEIAEIVGVSTSTFSDWIQGKKYPRIDKIEILANFFKILKSDLIEDKKEMKKNNDTLTDIVIRMRRDADFLSVVETIYNLDSEKLNGVKSLLLAFSTTDK